MLITIEDNQYHIDELIEAQLQIIKLSDEDERGLLHHIVRQLIKIAMDNNNKNELMLKAALTTAETWKNVADSRQRTIEEMRRVINECQD